MIASITVTSSLTLVALIVKRLAVEITLSTPMNSVMTPMVKMMMLASTTVYSPPAAMVYSEQTLTSVIYSSRSVMTETPVIKMAVRPAASLPFVATGSSVLGLTSATQALRPVMMETRPLEMVALRDALLSLVRSVPVNRQSVSKMLTLMVLLILTTSVPMERQVGPPTE